MPRDRCGSDHIFFAERGLISQAIEMRSEYRFYAADVNEDSTNQGYRPPLAFRLQARYFVSGLAPWHRALDRAGDSEALRSFRQGKQLTTWRLADAGIFAPTATRFR